MSPFRCRRARNLCIIEGDTWRGLISFFDSSTNHESAGELMTFTNTLFRGVDLFTHRR